jgi:iron complex outermembrane receptor protein
VGENQEYHGRLSVKYDPTEKLSLVFTADANDAKGGLRPYTTLIDEVPKGGLYTGLRFGSPTPAGPLRNSNTSADPYDNATGTIEVTEVTNSANGFSLTADYDISNELGTKFIYSQRSSEYKAGLDDDSTIFALDHYPERGNADQTSIELQLNGYLGQLDFVSGLYWFEEEGNNLQGDDSRYNGGSNLLDLNQKTTSKAAFFNLGYDMTNDLRVSGGLRYTKDEKEAKVELVIGPTYAADKWDELSYDLSANYTLENGLNVYGSIQSGYQSGQYPPRPYCLFTNPACFVATDNITAVNYEIGLKGQLSDNFNMSIAIFNTNYDDLPYQVSIASANGFDTSNLVVSQTSRGIEWESTAYLTDTFSLHTSLGYIDIDVDEQGGIKPVAPLTPDLTASISPVYKLYLNDDSLITARLDYSYRSDMYGEPSSDPARFTKIDARGIVNFNIGYEPTNANWRLDLYGRNIFDERYDDARINLNDYILVIKSNDASEFGVRYSLSF